MNWHITTTSKDIAKAEPQVELAEDEQDEPSKPLLTASRKAAKDIAAKLEGQAHIEVHAHETTQGRGFRPAHVTVSVSKVK